MATKKVQEEKPKTELITKETPVKNILKEAVGTLIVFENKEATEKKLKQLVKDKDKDIKNLISIPELNKEQLEEAKKIRAILRENRYGLQNISKHNTSVLNNAKKNNTLMIDELVVIITPSEDLIHEKIVAEENRIELAKQKEKEAEEKRILDIETKIADAGVFFEKELELYKNTKDWSKFDEFYKEFEENLEDLQEFEFEGSEVLEKYKKRKEDVLELEKKALELEQEKESLGEKEEQLATKEEELELEKKKLAENKRRLTEFFSIGFMFNGVDFFKGETKYSEEEINEKTEEEFNLIISGYKQAEENKKTYSEVMKEAEELNLDVSQFIIVDDVKEQVTEEQIATFKKFLEEAKTEAGKKAEEEKKAEAEKQAKELKAVGAIVCPVIDKYIKTMENYVVPSGLVNEEAKKYVLQFFQDQAKAFTELKAYLNQAE